MKAGCRDVQRASTITDSEEVKYLQLGELVETYGRDGRLSLVECDVTKGVVPLNKALQGCTYVVCATGARPSISGLLFGGADSPYNVDNLGTSNLVDAALENKCKAFVLVTSLLTNAAAVGQASNQNYIFLNLFGNVLVEKKKGEDYLKASGINYVIVRPGGLSDSPQSALGGLIMQVHRIHVD